MFLRESGQLPFLSTPPTPSFRWASQMEQKCNKKCNKRKVDSWDKLAESGERKRKKEDRREYWGFPRFPRADLREEGEQVAESRRERCEQGWQRRGPVGEREREVGDCAQISCSMELRRGTLISQGFKPGLEWCWGSAYFKSGKMKSSSLRSLSLTLAALRVTKRAFKTAWTCFISWK